MRDPFRIRARGNVSRRRDTDTALRGDLCHQGVHGPGVVIGRDDRGAFLRKPVHGVFTDPGCGACDDRDGVCKSARHLSLRW